MLTSKSKGRLHTIVIVSLVSGTINILLAIFKICVGIIGNSQALVADGVHSFADLLTDGLMVIAGHMGAQAPDKEHPYGHRRIETISSIVISSSLIIVSFKIAFDTFQHLMHYIHSDIPTFSVIITAIISIIANESLFHYTLAKSNEIHSNLLRANAWHNRSDALVSLIVLIGIIGARFGVSYSDSIGALIIVLLILRISIKMICNNIKELIDTAVDDETLKLIAHTISTISDVVSIHQLRTRYHSGSIFVDVHIQVASDISVSEGHHISEKVHVVLLKNIPYIADVTVHIDPEDDASSMPSVILPSRKEVYQLVKIHWENLPGFKDIRRTILHYLNGKLYVDIYLPLTIIDKEKETLTLQYQNAIHREKIIEKVTVYFE
ncbi:cation diffusion facilitator family transporter [Coxiella endosymbiont of Amblyomma nuttalli]|uniref:cation diffusion facilitator family transporter n=1 Tax=Coxiella endosymbiont of Amblyomma nuttalli TaxID=2749996 RepID=UPI001BA48F75|nr:cation diffusion facilitator family transporter [Coxiella endosymbiont of Amblyomma nuttalli]QTS83848.1 putative cation efflux system protein/MT2084 [Coxiella endosymbiont of Amblyomma nuttalli]